jgi:hypothetical protein
MEPRVRPCACKTYSSPSIVEATPPPMARQTTQTDETRRPHDSLATFVIRSMGLLIHLPSVLLLAVEEAVHALHVVDRVRARTAEDNVAFLEVRIGEGSLDGHNEVVTRTAMEDVVPLFPARKSLAPLPNNWSALLVPMNSSRPSVPNFTAAMATSLPTTSATPIINRTKPKRLTVSTNSCRSVSLQRKSNDCDVCYQDLVGGVFKRVAVGPA